MKHIALLCNPTTEAIAKALPLTEFIETCLQQRNIQYTSFTTVWPTGFTGFTDVWIIGGDGTMNYFINHYHQIDLPLSVFKGGSGNDFHWMLYGDIEPEAQIEQILKGSLQYVDVGICNGRFFLNGVGIGFDGAIVKDLLGKNKVAGKASYLLSVLKHIVSYSEKLCTLEWNDGIMTQACFMISVANGKRYGGGFKVAPGASLTDGVLDLNIVGRIPALKRIKYLPVIEKGEHINLPFNQYLQKSNIIFRSPSFWHAHIDGEYIYSNFFEIGISDKKIAFAV